MSREDEEAIFGPSQPKPENENVVPLRRKPGPKKRRKYTRRAAPAPAAAKLDEFAGLTKTHCCTACKVERCVISGKPYCAHPVMGGLHAPEMTNAETLARFNRAKKKLLLDKIERMG